MNRFQKTYDIVGPHGGSSVSVPIINELQTTGYTEYNLIKDLTMNSVPEKRSKRTSIKDDTLKMGNHYDKYINKGLINHTGQLISFDKNHINKK